MFSMKQERKDRILFFGDSITQMGANNGGYTDLLKKNLEKNGMAEQYEIIASGVGYNKVYDLYLRMDDDVLAKKPDKVFIWIGVNVVGHKVTGTGTDPDKFENFTKQLFKRCRLKISSLFCVRQQ